MTFWLGIDGEGIGRDPHRYVLLAYSDSVGGSDSIENQSGLSTVDCLDFLLELPTFRGLNVAGYFLGYDWTMILRDLPNKSIYRLLRPVLRKFGRDEGNGFSSIRWRNYRLHYLNGMMRIQCGDQRRTIWDVGRFFQAPFVDAIEAWGIGKKERDFIADMKSRRNQFESHDFADIKRYCLLECRLLAELVEALEASHEDLNLRPRVWFGPGSTAGVALNRMSIRRKRGRIPPEVEHAALCAFFGGRFE